MKRAGVQDKVGMQISGNKTRAIFDRYNIVDEGDIGSAGEKLAQYFKQRKKDRAAKLQRVKWSPRFAPFPKIAISRKFGADDRT
jgi:hypothetical protein